MVLTKQCLTVVAILLGSGVAGCSYVLEIKIEDWRSGAPHFSLRENSVPIIGRCPSLREFAVYPRSGSAVDYEAPVWRASLHGGARTCELTYGAVPNGFPDTHPPTPLEPGREYRAFAQGWGSGGWLDFVAEPV